MMGAPSPDPREEERSAPWVPEVAAEVAEEVDMVGGGAAAAERRQLVEQRRPRARRLWRRAEG